MSYVEITKASLTKAAEAAGSKLHHYERMSENNKLGASIEAHARTLDAFEAFRREVSDAVEQFNMRWANSSLRQHNWEDLLRFIIPKPVDPLAEALNEALGRAEDYEKADANDLREALAKRGGRIVFDEEKAGE